MIALGCVCAGAWQLWTAIAHHIPPRVAVGVVLVGLAGGIALGVVRWTRRCGAWLDGTLLRTVGLFTTTWYQLATADVWAVAGRRFAPGWRLFGMDAIGQNLGNYAPVYISPTPLLRIRDVHTGLWTQLPLRERSGVLLDPSLLRALADAIHSGPRPQPQAVHAHSVALQLRDLATRSPWS